MNINILHVYSDLQIRDKIVGAVVKIIRKRLSELCHNA